MSSRSKGEKPDAELQARIDAVRADYEEQLDARHAAARGFVDAILRPEELRSVLGFALRAGLHNPGPAHRAVRRRLETVSPPYGR
jgi:3-methylcrotonyl-CoA carboxylase beta subunit